MKFPKNRANLYLVERIHVLENIGSICGAFSSLEEADDYKDACEQEWKDKAGEMGDVVFSVTVTTYYG